MLHSLRTENDLNVCVQRSEYVDITKVLLTIKQPQSVAQEPSHDAHSRNRRSSHLPAQ